MELDTGAAVSLINHTLYRKEFSHFPLEESEHTLRSYGGNPLKVAGQITVPICYQQQEATLPLVVVKTTGKAVPLLGRNWLTTLILDWPKLFPHAAAVRRLANVAKSLA